VLFHVRLPQASHSDATDVDEILSKIRPAEYERDFAEGFRLEE